MYSIIISVGLIAVFSIATIIGIIRGVYDFTHGINPELKAKSNKETTETSTNS